MSLSALARPLTLLALGACLAAVSAGGCGDSGGTTGSAGTTGTAGTTGSAGTTGTAGTTGSAGTSGTAGSGGGTAGSGGTGGATAGTGGNAGGTGGAAGAGGGGRGGAGGAGGRGGSGGATGTGGAGGGATGASVTFAPIAPGTITGTAVFTTVTDGVQVVINLANCPAGAHPIHIHEGTSCTSTTTQGMHWGGTNGPGENIGPNGGEITCTSAMTGTLTYTRPNTPTTTAWTIGPPSASNVLGHAMVVHSSTVTTDRHACGVIQAN